LGIGDTKALLGFWQAVDGDAGFDIFPRKPAGIHFKRVSHVFFRAMRIKRLRLHFFDIDNHPVFVHKCDRQWDQCIFHPHAHRLRGSKYKYHPFIRSQTGAKHQATLVLCRRGGDFSLDQIDAYVERRNRKSLVLLCVGDVAGQECCAGYEGVKKKARKFFHIGSTGRSLLKVVVSRWPRQDAAQIIEKGRITCPFDFSKTNTKTNYFDAAGADAAGAEASAFGAFLAFFIFLAFGADADASAEAEAGAEAAGASAAKAETANKPAIKAAMMFFILVVSQENFELKVIP
jgi:hypothetical protein